MPVLPSRLTEPLWDQFAALLPKRPTFDPAHPLGCHRRRISERIVFDKLLQILRCGCSYEAIADSTCSATTIRNRRDEWISLGVFSRLKQIALDAYDRVVGLVLDQISVDGAITKAPRRRRSGRTLTRRPGQTGYETVGHDRRLRHPARSRPGRRQPSRLATSGTNSGSLERTWSTS
ncbi:hypothetical protein GCM10010339_83960 [Streptomyces alanosinicus]|uniref:Insertion element IS402-like domain-containing protein n=1 Tax=Streptomyces alanosinicus TaxID=68171 RepID=A0A919D6D8_9ACTN|nr:hypothetical protein GCM10010339_83960 [Streptomyces alanosinicus]